ncbi:Cytochrome c oxidase subunit 6 [Tilletia horrida]|uniref:Cytochrome c oxidase subunit 6, mitochondrial n=1 Tax=Tilletia horrida TaxID=155126 RepID=A0AAN6JST2_9BASI|nr:Cytochrome c oxidase subunit 6 [Tilletia horrida]KAK0553225.1 Cytochrome c oxidase subunit 6 [Tilletia horrida]KAK0565291.1 Cytochrome c oxidase subunit 6 [Tilletia horrida]
MSSSLFTGVFRSVAVASSARASLVAAGSSARPLAAALVAPRAARGYASHHEEESFEAFNARYVTFFKSVEDLFELQRGLNNCFSYDLVPAPEVIEEALRAARRVNDYPTAVRVFEGIKEKVENVKQYRQYVDSLKPLREELGIQLKEELYNA